MVPVLSVKRKGVSGRKQVIFNKIQLWRHNQATVPMTCNGRTFNVAQGEDRTEYQRHQRPSVPVR